MGSKRNWEDTDDLDMLFHGTYVADFYRRIRDLLHREADGFREGGHERARLDGAWAELERRQEEFRNSVTADA
jgi:anaerobic magnesium-protoporphyrin IX monomethyl ester cyclase